MSDKCRNCKFYKVEKINGSRSSGICINQERIDHNKKFGRCDYIMNRYGSSPICKHFKRWCDDQGYEREDKFMLTQEEIDLDLDYCKKALDAIDSSLNIIAHSVGCDASDIEEEAKKSKNKFNIGDTVYIPAKIKGIELRKFNNDKEERIFYKLDKTFTIAKEDENYLSIANAPWYKGNRYKCMDIFTENMLKGAIDNG